MFLVLTPEEDDDQQLEILKSIGSALLRDETRQELADCNGEDAIRDRLTAVFAERAVA